MELACGVVDELRLLVPFLKDAMVEVEDVFGGWREGFWGYLREPFEEHWFTYVVVLSSLSKKNSIDGFAEIWISHIKNK